MLRLPPRQHLARIILAAAVAAANAADQLLEDSATNGTTRSAGNALASRPHTNRPLPTEMVWTESGNTYVGLGGDLYVGQDGRVVRQVPVLSAVGPGGQQGWTWVDTGQRVKIMNPALKAKSLEGGTVLHLGCASRS